jgi:hypothetical protein
VSVKDRRKVVNPDSFWTKLAVGKEAGNRRGRWLKWQSMSTVEEIERAIERLDAKQQARLLRELPSLLKIAPDEVAFMELAEPAFEFWDNPEDAAYDKI